MATTHTDVLGMLNRLSPLRAARPEPDPRVIAHRWESLKPFVLIRARQALDPAASFAFFKQRHVEYFTRLRQANISPEAIIRRSLDDPLVAPARFELELVAAIERRRARLGRVKGRVKPPPRVHKSKGRAK